ncbi:hypothetical protein Ancab_006655 [Ancistrocladus abbreviatus]
MAGFSAVHVAFAVPPPPATRVCTHIPDTDPFNRNHFPQDFIFSVGSSAYQSDIKFLKNMGVDAFRFSISWSRILPKGKISGGVNEKGVEFYHKLIDLLLNYNIQPFVTLFHWDLPQALQDDYRGFLSPMIVKDFRDYADFCFKTFGKKVKYWTTLNEPNLYARFGYDDGTFAPGRCSKFVRDCQYGDSSLEPYIVAHHELLCHAAAVDIYRKNHQASQKGVIGITIVTFWNIAIDWTHPNRRAAARANEFLNGWYRFLTDQRVSQSFRPKVSLDF